MELASTKLIPELEIRAPFPEMRPSGSEECLMQQELSRGRILESGARQFPQACRASSASEGLHWHGRPEELGQPLSAIGINSGRITRSFQIFRVVRILSSDGFYVIPRK